MHLEIRARIDTSSSLPQIVVLQCYMHPPSRRPPSNLSLPDSVWVLTGGSPSCRFSLPRLAGISVTSSPLAGPTTDVCLPTHSGHRSPPHKFLRFFFLCASLLATDRARSLRPWPANLGEVAWPAPTSCTCTLGTGPHFPHPQGSRQARTPAWVIPLSPASCACTSGTFSCGVV